MLENHKQENEEWIRQRRQENDEERQANAEEKVIDGTCTCMYVCMYVCAVCLLGKT